MAKEQKRFVEVYSKGMGLNTKVLVDRETRVQYLYVSQGYSGGLTALLDADGRPQRYQGSLDE